MRTIRCFLAVNLAVDVVRRVADEQKRLRQICEAAGVRVSWVAPPNMHLTIRFLGDVAEPLTRALSTIVEPGLRCLEAFEVEAAGLGVFPDLERPRVVWAGVRDPEGRLVALHDAVSERLVEAGFEPEDRPFRSHLTIGRVKSGDGAALSAALAEVGEREFGRSRIGEIVLYRSDLRPSGAEYKAIWRLPLPDGPRSRTPHPQPAAQDGPLEKENP